MRFFILVAALLSVSAPVSAASPQFLVGEGVRASPAMTKTGWLENCIVQSAPNRQGLYKVKCNGEVSLIAPEWMVSNPDQTTTSRTFVCPGGGKPCYFKA